MAILISFGSELFDTIGFRLVLGKQFVADDL